MRKGFRWLLVHIGRLLLIAGLLLLYVNFTDRPVKSTEQLIEQLQALNPRVVSVEGVPIYEQPDAYTCGITTVSAVASYLRQEDVPPASLIEKYGIKGGMNEYKFYEILAKELRGFQVRFMNDLSDTELINAVHESLKNGFPVPVFLGSANPYNKPFNDFHASVVTGMNLNTLQVQIANVYGYEEQISLNEFLNRMAYRGPNYPLVQKVVLRLGLMPENLIFQITKQSGNDFGIIGLPVTMYLD